MSARRISLGAKLGASFAALLVLSALLAAVALGRMGTMDREASVVGRSDLPSVRTIGTVDARQADFRAAQYRLISETTAAGMDDVVADRRAMGQAVDRAFAGYRATVSDARDRALWTEARQLWSRYVRASSAYEQLARVNRNAEANAVLGRYGGQYDRLTAQLQRWADYNRKLADTDVSDAHGAYTGARSLVFGMLVAMLLLGAGLALLVTRGIRRSVGDVQDRIASLRDHDVRDLQAGLGALAAGDLTKPVQPSTRPIDRLAADELGDVARGINTIIAALGDTAESYGTTRAALAGTIGDVAHTAQLLSASSQQMASTSDEAGRAVGEIANASSEVAAGAERQVQSLETTRAAMREVLGAAEASVAAAGAARDEATDADRVAADGARSVAEATTMMQAVSASSEEARDAIRALGEKSGEIGGIVDTITAIAEQTNLLALNAAIEAARAGDQGRGFAVVADEVRKLAEESQHAAASIASLIAAIQAETRQAVDVVQAGAARTAAGATTVEEARAAFEQIVERVKSVSVRVEEIAGGAAGAAVAIGKIEVDLSSVAALAEQSAASSEQVSASTEQTSASAQEIAASAEELSSAAVKLEQLVGRFVVER